MNKNTTVPLKKRLALHLFHCIANSFTNLDSTDKFYGSEQHSLLTGKACGECVALFSQPRSSTIEVEECSRQKRFVNLLFAFESLLREPITSISTSHHVAIAVPFASRQFAQRLTQVVA